MINYINNLNKSLNILVVGDIMVDLFSFCGSNKMSAEVDIPVTFVEREEMRLGGAANVWNNLEGLKANAILCGSVGDDKCGSFVKECVKQTDCLAKGKKTTVKHRYYLSNNQVFRVDYDYICNHNIKTYEKIYNAIKNKKFDGIVISDYLKGFCNESFIKKLIEYANENNIFVAVDSKFKDISKFAGANLVKINKHEYKRLFNKEFNIKDKKHIQHILNQNNISKLLVTLGKDGMVLFSNENTITINSNVVKNADVIGAGDCVISCYIVAYLNDFKEEDCLKFATLCAEYCIGKVGTKNFSIDGFKKEFYE